MIKDNWDTEMLKDYQALLNSKAYWENCIVLKAWKFWDKHWKKLSEYLSFKDNYIILNQDKPWIKDFFDKSKWIVTDDNYTFWKEQLADWVYTKNYISKLWAWVSDIRMDTLGWFMNNQAKFNYESILQGIDDIMEKKHSNPKEAYKAFKDLYWPFEKQITITAWKYAKDWKFDYEANYTRPLNLRWLTPWNWIWWERSEDFFKTNFDNYHTTSTVWTTIPKIRIKTEDILKAA